MAFLFFAYCSMLTRNTLLLFSFCLEFSFASHSQTPQQWAQTVNWDGVTHWSRYINMLPAKMGPNALSVPYTTNGSIDNNDWVSGSLQVHSRTGEKAQSIVLNGNFNLVKNVISFNLSYIPAEYYTMSDSLKRERHVYYEFWNDKKARGDMLMNINIKLLKKLEEKIQLALRIGYRYPSSNGFASARFTDNMGYWFDISAGKPLGQSKFKLIAMLGFYCWQIDRKDLRQDDAFLYGTGLEYKSDKLRFETTISGYQGYLEKEGDKPMIYRAALEKKLKKTGFLLRFQQGLHDFKYTTVEAGVKQYF
jgi:hypothetical protein